MADQTGSYADLYLRQIAVRDLLSVQRKARILAQYVALPGKIHDVGSGLGFMSLALLNIGYDVVSLDLSISMVTLAARIHGRRLNSIIAGASSIPFRAESFDAVVYSGVLHHLSDIPAALKEASTALKWDGQILAFEPNREAWVRRTLPYAILGRLHKANPLSRLKTPSERALSRDELLGAADAAGLETTQVHTYRPFFLTWLPNPLYRLFRALFPKVFALHEILEDAPLRIKSFPSLGCTLFARFARCSRRHSEMSNISWSSVAEDRALGHWETPAR